MPKGGVDDDVPLTPVARSEMKEDRDGVVEVAG